MPRHDPSKPSFRVQSGGDPRVGGVRPQAALTPDEAKRLGAFYTPPPIARKLVSWAVRSPDDRVLDSSFGGLVFLGAAAERLQELGIAPAKVGAQIFGIELDADAHAFALEQTTIPLDHANLVCANFFDVSPGPIPTCTAVVGNPPYIRYQGFNQDSDRAHQLAADAGVKLTRLSSSWAPFLIHASAFVEPGGRLAQVLPAELLHAQYASEVLKFLERSYGSVTIVAFEERVFPGALEEVVLLFAEDKGATPAAGHIEMVSCRTLADFVNLSIGGPAKKRSKAPEVGGSGKLLFQLLDEETQELYRRVAESPQVETLGDIASVDIGAVTGDNKFFLVAQEAAETIGERLFRLTISKARHVSGCRLSRADIKKLSEKGEKLWLFAPEAKVSSKLPKEAKEYLLRGEKDGVDKRYKTRIRDPWWSVPLPKNGVPDLFLTYCSNEHPRLVLNEAGALNTNTVHGVTLHSKRHRSGLAASFVNSLTLLSAELVGRSYGGGVLKLEPTEAERLLIPGAAARSGRSLARVDRDLRADGLESVLGDVDQRVLGAGLGLSAREIELLRSAAAKLRERRRSRGKEPR